MFDTPSIPFTLLAFIAVLGPLVFFHELGHYMVGRWCGIRADVFSVGFGKEVFGWTDKRGTRWKVGWIGRVCWLMAAAGSVFERPGPVAALGLNQQARLQ